MLNVLLHSSLYYGIEYSIFVILGTDTSTRTYFSLDIIIFLLIISIYALPEDTFVGGKSF